MGLKGETLDAFRQLAIRKTQWSEYMERVLEIITINTSSNDVAKVINTESYPYKIKDMSLPQCNTGFVYMLISLRKKDYTYWDYEVTTKQIESA